jgi:DNA-binding NarL/FixJ family response regulator
MNAEIRVLLVDDHPIVRHGVRQAIESDRSVKVVAEAGDGRQALELIKQLKPEIVVLDIDMPELDGLGVARAITEEKLGVKVIFLTIHREENMFDNAIGLDVKGYVLKDSAISDILSCVKAVAAGQSFTSPALTTYLLGRKRRASSFEKEQTGLQSLTPTERRVLILIADYKTTKEIAEEMFISPRTVDTHRTNICHKLEIRDKPPACRTSRSALFIVPARPHAA